MLIKCLQESISEAAHHDTPSLEDKSVLLDAVTQGYRSPGGPLLSAVLACIVPVECLANHFLQ